MYFLQLYKQLSEERQYCNVIVEQLVDVCGLSIEVILTTGAPIIQTLGFFVVEDTINVCESGSG